MRLLVTGGTGFIGSHLAEQGTAARRGGRGARSDRPAGGAGQRGAAAAARASRCCRAASRTRSSARGRSVARPTCSISRWRCGKAPRADEFFESVNLDGTRRLLEASVEEGVRRFVYCSTIGIYGHRAPGITREDSPLAPGNIYERTKVAAERLVREFGAERSLPYVDPAAGRRVRTPGPAAAQALQGRERGPVPLLRRRGRTAAHDLRGRRRLRLLPRLRTRPGALGGSFILAGPKPCTLRELVAEVQKATASKRYGSGYRSSRCSRVAGGGGGCLADARSVEPPIYRRRMDFFWSDSEFDTTPRPAGAGLGAAGGPAGRDPAHAGRLSALGRAGIMTGGGPLTEPWQIKLFRRSLKKKETMKALLDHLPPVEGRHVPRARLRHRAHLVLPPPAGRHLDQLRLRARPRPVRPAAGRRAGGPHRRADAAVSHGVVRRRRAPSTSWSTSRTTTASSPRWCGCSSRAGSSSSWRRRASTGGAGFALKRRARLHGGSGRLRPRARRLSAGAGPRADAAARPHGAQRGRLLPDLHRVAGGPAQLRLSPEGDGRGSSPRSRTSTATPPRCRPRR